MSGTWCRAINHNDTKPEVVEVRILAPISYNTVFKVVNGAWDDGTAQDKVVTLTGFEGDTLRLTAEQIPVAGSSPADSYQAGAWDVIPDTGTAITQDTTYTYTYKALPIRYTAVQGDGSSWQKGSGGTLTFVFKRSVNDEETISHFAGVFCDNVELTRDLQYTATSGSAVVTLQNAFLELLETGDHSLTAMFDDGEPAGVDVTFKVLEAETATQAAGTSGQQNTSAAAPAITAGGSGSAAGSGDRNQSVPNTGDTSQTGLWITLLVLAVLVIAGVAGTYTYRKRREK